jgi:ATP-dependent Clp protease ATP-binding subunit ClpB
MAQTPRDPTTMTLARYQPEAKSLVAGAQSIADERRHAQVIPLHLLARALERSSVILELLRAAPIDTVALGAATMQQLLALPTVDEPSHLSTAMLELLKRAEQRADVLRSESVELEHVLHALTQEVRGPAGDLLTAHGIFPGSLEPHYGILRRARSATSANAPNGDAGANLVDWVERARNGQMEPTLGRDQELRRVVTILERRTKCHPLLVGEQGVGKSSIVRALGRRIADGDVPTSLSSARLFEFDLGVILAGTRLRSDIEERLRRMLVGLATAPRENILFIRGLEQLVGQGQSSSGVLEPIVGALARGDLRLLGTTTPEGLRRLSDKASDLLHHFSVLQVDEPSISDATEILRGISGRYESHHQVAIANAAIVSATELAKRYLQDRFLPDSAVDLLDEAAARLRVETDGLSSEKDGVIQRYRALRVQIESLLVPSDDDSRNVRQRLQVEQGEIAEQVEALQKERESRRGVVAAVRQLRAELEQARSELQVAKSKKNYARLGELEHSVLPELEARLQKAEQAAGGMAVDAEKPCLTSEMVAQTLAAWTGIPLSKMLEAEADKLASMAERLSERVVGQPEATGAIARAVRRGRVGLRDAKRPIGSFLFLGPSGVGKTELAKAVAEFLFDDEQSLTRLDMSEFMERHMAQRLVGAPPGYADSEQGGFLTEAVRRRPYSVLLFDEVEKAHADVFNLLLQVLDDGRLTDGRGRLADFSNTVVVMTSNIGSGRILSTDLSQIETDAGRAALKETLLEELRGFFRPELLNRIDEVVVFRPLSRAVLKRILGIQLKSLGKLVAPRGVTLSCTPAAEDRLVELAYEPAFGARPLRRVVAREIQDPLAEAMLAGRHAAGTRVTVDVNEQGQIVLKTESDARKQDDHV